MEHTSLSHSCFTLKATESCSFFFLLLTKERLEEALSQPEQCTTHLWGYFPRKLDIADKASALPPQRSSESIRQVYLGDLKTSDGFFSSAA